MKQHHFQKLNIDAFPEKPMTEKQKPEKVDQTLHVK
jgi:hypothetical protein